MLDNLDYALNPYYAKQDGELWQVVEQHIGETRVVETGLGHMQAERLAEKLNKAFHNKWSAGRARKKK